MREPRNLKEQVIDFINMQQEGEYWDFKKEWYAEGKKVDLLHDIICMANNHRNCDAYIIIGVDESDGFKLSSVENNPNRRNTQEIVDFLKDKKFAGGIRPIVYVESVTISEALIDVIIIKNSRNTPFYLTDPFQGIRANNIYTRVMDTNTPIDKSADVDRVEELWKKRFHMDEKPKDLVCYYLQDAERWESSPSGENAGFFYSHYPEYTIKESENDGTAQKYYMFDSIDRTPFWFYVTVYYHQTALAQYSANGLDGSRCCVIAPDHGFIYFGHPGGQPDISYDYYILGSLRHRLLEFYRAKGVDEYTYDRFTRLMLFFDSDEEQKGFEAFIMNDPAAYEKAYAVIDDAQLPSCLDDRNEYYKQMKKQYRDALVLNQLLTVFRTTKSQAAIQNEK